MALPEAMTELPWASRSRNSFVWKSPPSSTAAALTSSSPSAIIHASVASRSRWIASDRPRIPSPISRPMRSASARSGSAGSAAAASSAGTLWMPTMRRMRPPRAYSPSTPAEMAMRESSV